MPQVNSERQSPLMRLHWSLYYTVPVSALLCAVLLSGCNTSAASSAGGAASSLSHSNAPQWKILGIGLEAMPDQAKQLIQKQWPQAIISYPYEDLVVSNGIRIPKAPRLVARPESGSSGLREQLVIQFDYQNRIVLIAHGKTFPSDSAPPMQDFLQAFSKQYAPGVDNG